MTKFTFNLQSFLKVVVPTMQQTEQLALPPEIWAIVASYLADQELLPLKSLNRVFYTAALDRQYNEVDLCYLERFNKQVRLLS
ncbi:hypothetical protein H0H93_002281, partial [Arthromyces matolae]